jgi:hypothetical protein
MNDHHPEELNIEIDRDALRRYPRVKWLMAWAWPLVFFGGMFGFLGIGNHFDNGIDSLLGALMMVLKCVATGVDVGLLIALAGYLLFSHRLAAGLSRACRIPEKN